MEDDADLRRRGIGVGGIHPASAVKLDVGGGSCADVDDGGAGGDCADHGTFGVVGMRSKDSFLIVSENYGIEK